MADLTWTSYLKPLTESVSHRLKEIKNKDFIDFCLQSKDIRNFAEKYLENLIKYIESLPKKNSDIAVKKKVEGNLKFKEKKLAECNFLYSQCILYANKTDDCLPLAYANRSLVLQNMGYFKESLQDIEMALSTGYPKDKTKKLVMRKEKCLAQLKLEKGNQFNLPEPTGGYNENFVGASKHLNVCYTSTKGRHVVAAADIQIGDVLFVEKPFAFVLFMKDCNHCCQNIVALIPCWYCTSVFFCSTKCRDDSWHKSHSFECGYDSIFISVGIAHLSLKIILSASSSFDQLKDILSKLEQPQYKDGIVPIKSNKYDSVFHLVTNMENYDKNDMFEYAMTAVLLGLYMKKYTNYFSPTSEDDDLKVFTTAVLHHILQLICNGHAIVDTFSKDSMKYIAEETEERIGTAIYPSASMMNHSCEPSIINSFYKDYLIVRAAKNIKKGEEVFNCYGPHARRMKRLDRQDILSKQYFFNCDCSACSPPFDIYDKYTALKCGNCKGPVISMENNKGFCLNCGSSCEVTEKLMENQNLIPSLLAQGDSYFKVDVNLALKKYLESWMLGREILYKFHKDLGCAADKIGKCLMFLQEYKKCIMFLKCSVLSVQERFGSFSIELANEMKKIGDVITVYCMKCSEDDSGILAQEGIEFYRKVGKIIKLLYGSHHADLSKIEENKKILETKLNNN